MIKDKLCRVRKWDHNCDECEYLGSLAINGVISQHFDFYRHNNLRWISYLARFGPEDWQYVSWPDTALRQLKSPILPELKVLQQLCQSDGEE